MIMKRLLIALPMLLLGTTVAHAQIGMGAVGDSLTDEYLDTHVNAEVDVAAASWVQILAATRAGHLDFGEFRSSPSGWSGHRDSGYEHNFAKAGGAAWDGTRLRVRFWFFNLNLQITNSFMGSQYLDNQTTGLLSYVNSGAVSLVYVGAGSNDLYYYMNRFNTSGVPTQDRSTVTNSVINNVVSDILESVDRLQAAGADVVLGMLPTGTAGGEATGDLLAKINSGNTQLIAAAAARGIPIVDVFGFSADPSRFDGTNYTVGSLTIPAGSAATAPGDVSTSGSGFCRSDGKCATASHATKFAADDGLHPNTAIQGLIANQILGAANSAYGTGIPLLTDAEIVALTGAN